MRRRPFSHVTLRTGWLIPLLAGLAFFLAPSPGPAEAVIERIYTLPFYDSFSITCGFGCYAGHEGTDYVVGVSGVGGEQIATGASGTAMRCPFSQTAGNYVVVDHGNGHRTRYLHLRDPGVPPLYPGAQVSRGEIIGYEGNTGYTDPPGFYHLHFETRHAATTFTCGKDGTAVDAYAASTYMWTLDPPVYSASTCYYPQTSSSGPGPRPGVFRPEQNHYTWWYLRYSNTSGPADNAFTYGDTCDIPVVGDWNGDGVDTIGIFRPYGATGPEWHLRNSNSPGLPYTVFVYGVATDWPIAGDWDGDGVDTIGVFRPTGGAPEWHLRNSNSAGLPDIPPFGWGNNGDLPVVGNWDGDLYLTVTIGVFRRTGGAPEWHLRNYNSPGPDSYAFTYGNDGDIPITGDWDWDWNDTIGVVRPAVAAPEWYLRNYNSTGPNSIPMFTYGVMSDKPITGNWR